MDDPDRVEAVLGLLDIGWHPKAVQAAVKIADLGGSREEMIAELERVQALLNDSSQLDA